MKTGVSPECGKFWVELSLFQAVHTIGFLHIPPFYSRKLSSFRFEKELDGD